MNSTQQTYIDRAREVIQTEMEALQLVMDSLDEAFCDAVDAILETTAKGHKVVVTGVGKSLHIGQKIAATLTSTGTPTVILHPAEAMHGDLGVIQPGDIVIALSYSGESDEMNTLIPVIKRGDNRIIALTGNSESSLAKHSELVISVQVAREACPFNMAPSSSTTATLAVGDALALVLLQARGFEKKDYARLHPGGAIGRALLVRIQEVMRQGERLASVGPEASVLDALDEMTRARSGAVAVIDEDQKVLGVFTDGDLRRHITDPQPLAERMIRDVMTANPIQVQQGALAAEVLSVFEKHQIDDLVVVDEKGCLAGLVDLQDLPKFKIL